MYWRVRKAGLDQYVRQYGLHAALAASLCLNGLLILTRPSGKPTVTKEQKADMDGFARSVTNHLLDTSYISYRKSTLALTTELAANPVQAMLAKAGMLALGADDLNAQEKSLQDKRQLSAVAINEVVVGDPDANHNGLIPIDVKGVVAIHSTDESGTADPQPFRFKYWIGNKTDAKRQPVMDANGKPMLMVANLEDLSSQPEPAAPTGGPASQ